MSKTTRRAFLIGGTGLLPVSHAAARPNILFLFPDQHRFDWTGFNPNLSVRTPNLDKLAARGVRFTQAVVASPLCAPSRACLASGKEYDRCGVRSNEDNYPIQQRTYYSLLRDGGYHVTGCGKLDLHKGTRDWGLDGKRLLPEWGFSDGIDNAGKVDAIASGAVRPKDPYMAYLHREGLAATHVEDFRKRLALGNGYPLTFPTPLPDNAYCDNWVGNNGLQLMQQFPKGKPWHLVVNFTGPHNPEDITARMEKLARGRPFPQPNQCQEYSAETHVAIRQNYTGMVENIDRWVGIFLDELKSRGELDNTLIVYSSDHGEMLGDHDRWGKVVPYHASVSVPLIVAGPGVRRGISTGALVSHMDLASTFLDYAGVRRPVDMESRSIRPVLEGKRGVHRDYVRSGLGPWRMVYDGRFKLVRGYDAAQKGHALARAGDAKPLLFDLKDDPLENVDIAAKAVSEVERLAKLLPGG